MNTSSLHSKSWNVTVTQVNIPNLQGLVCKRLYCALSWDVVILYWTAYSSPNLQIYKLHWPWWSNMFSECNFRICKTWLHQCQSSSFSQKLNGCGYAEEDTLRPLWWSQRFEGLGELRMVERKAGGNAGDLSSGTAAVVCHTNCTYTYIIIYVLEWMIIMIVKYLYLYYIYIYRYIS